jgi:L-ascorbate metabolism protein UlaG (beta-lactamase superfamily)
MLGGCGGPRWTGPESDHFDGRRFHNPGVSFDKGLTDVLRYLMARDPGDWQALEAQPGPPPIRRAGAGELVVTPINHASVLIQADGLNLLTDPIWSKRASPLGWAGPARYRPPGIRFEDLPPIDAVLISHNHYDHMDLPTLRRLVDRDDPLIFVPLGDAQLLRKLNSQRIHELDWGQSAELPNGRRVWGQRCVHWSGRFGTLDRNASLWLAYLVETDQGPVYFGGDTGYGDHFQQTRDQFGPVRLALLPIGAYEPRWLVGVQHINPAEAVRAHQVLQAQHSIGIHYGTFELSDVGQSQPPADLAEALEAANLPPERFRAAEYGQATVFERQLQKDSSP